ncbi:MAG TPA: AMP-binding protein, partial [Acidimicrobiales bacterium]
AFDEAVDRCVQVRLADAQGQAVAPELRAAAEAADAQLFAPLRSLFGGKLRLAISGAAPIAADVLRLFYAAGVTVLEGWGMTETSGVGTVNLPDAIEFGTVGRALPGVDVKIADDGEILVHGPVLFTEYWQNPEATAETLTADGWLLTGDLGAIDDDGFLSITGRKKDIIITAGGKNLTPANLENDLKQAPWISQAVMYADRRPYPVALITLDQEEIAPWATAHDLPTDLKSLCHEPAVIDLVQGALDTANAKYAQVEQIKRFAILDHDFTQDDGLLTPTLKLKRNVVYERYAAEFAELYD